VAHMYSQDFGAQKPILLRTASSAVPLVTMNIAKADSMMRRVRMAGARGSMSWDRIRECREEALGGIQRGAGEIRVS